MLTAEAQMPYLIDLVEDVYAGDVNSAAFYDVHQVIDVAVLFEMDVGIMYSVL